MSDVKRLLDEATSLPWYQTEEFIPADAALIVYAVNHLPAYEAAVEALEHLRTVYAFQWDGLTQDMVGEALRRLRDEVPA